MVRGRTGRGVGFASKARGILIDTDAGYYYKDLPAKNGRPRGNDPTLVRVALLRADAYARRMRTQVEASGGGQSVARASEIGVDLFFAARVHPITPTLFECVVAAGKMRLGMQTSVKNLTRTVSAANTGVPVEALTALERALK